MTVILDQGLKTVCENLTPPPQKKKDFGSWNHMMSRSVKNWDVWLLFFIAKSGVLNILLYKKFVKLIFFNTNLFLCVCVFGVCASLAMHTHCFTPLGSLGSVSSPLCVWNLENCM